MTNAPISPDQRLVIAVDGPAASGKGTLAAKLAAHYGLPHLDTGSLYRAVAKKTLLDKQTRGEHALVPYDGRNPNLADEVLAAEMARSLNADDLKHPDLSSESIGQAASIISAMPQVRDALLAYQRNFAAQGNGAVLDGRDIGTVICPEATAKLYINASAEVRAERRFKQQEGAVDEVSYETILMAIEARDNRDMRRTTAPLTPADDAIYLDTSTMGIDEVFAKSLALIAEIIAGREARSA